MPVLASVLSPYPLQHSLLLPGQASSFSAAIDAYMPAIRRGLAI